MKHRSRPYAACAVLLLVPACAGQASKPVDTPELRKEATPALQGYVARVLGAGGRSVKLVRAEPFPEGFTHETWKLTVEVGGEARPYAFKLFESDAAAKHDAESHEAARGLGWPVPADAARGSAEPYKAAPAVLRDYVPGVSLAQYTAAHVKAGKPGPELAPALADLGRLLGGLHSKGMRPRQAGDIDGAAALTELVELCELEGWCGPYARKQLLEASKVVNGGEVTFVHGALHEQQVLLDEATGKVVSLVDLDESGWGDPALDVGTLLAHLLLVNPVARERAMGVPNPDAAELKVCAEAFLGAYRKAAGLSDEAWRPYMERVKAYMRVRVGKLLLQLRDNVHAKQLIALVDKRKVALFVIDPFEEYGIAY